MKIIKYSNRPDDSIILNNWKGTIDYIDSYKFEIINPDNLSIDMLASMILEAESPKWEKALAGIRNSIVSIFGLKTGMNNEIHKKQSGPVNFKAGDKIGFFPVIERSESEIVMALDDKHLGFRVSLLKKNCLDSGHCAVYMTTIVQFHNIWGKLYFIPVKPFHQIIVKQSLQRFLKLHKELDI